MALNDEIVITRKVFFSSGLADASSSAKGYGNNYELEAWVQGPLDPVSGLVINLTRLDMILKEVIAPLDQHHLNFEVPEFKGKDVNSSVLADYCAQKLSEKFLQLFPRGSAVKLRGIGLKTGEFERVEISYG